ncbi:MAG: threonine--tRNA ligase [Brevibacterium sp.]|uniref:Threonine--tRNA ligase n=2 Tax=Brevibacterium linens TaxID=1703 RepID=A0A2H1HL07_BRELN|nr:threonine--tRNA ligase [Brevibacterium linens]KAB1949535.1 threonine--tRNA ligase [Brevibacterium linens ATCC 9172]SMX63160.1 threonyl-tRNA synthetase [Brevibacterium linens ATCC 9172]SMX63556.1 threonyl-tRNA synthetase [Brevibacterium linens]
MADSIDCAGESIPFTEGLTGTEIFSTDRTVVAMWLNGEPADLSRELQAGDRIAPITIDSDAGLDILRHSTGHVTAQAVQELFPGTKLGIGPYITDGYYFDFDVAEPFTPEDLKAIQKKAAQIVKSGQTFNRVVVTEDEARERMANEPFKLELIDDKGKGGDEETSVEVGGGELTVYENVDRKGEVVWQDLCRGPHLPNTKLIGNGFAITRSSAAYWRGDQANASLQRVYGTAWASKDDLKAYQDRIAEAERRDHRKLGAEMDLFSFPEELGSGLPVFHPKGGVIKREMEDYVRARHIAEGFEYVGTPHISKETLYYTSGHLPYYGENMFPAMSVDEVRDESDQVVKEGTPYRLKAMNCPMHNLIYRSRGRSYRDLPLRLFEFGTVYRDEASGVIHGLTRVRALTQDDSHSYVAQEDAGKEIRHLLGFVLSLLRDFGLDDFYLELSTRDEDGKKADKFIGSDEQWAEATSVLEEVAQETGLELVPDPGGAAFYGPKISVQARDAIGRTWQMSTVQLDFNQPERFGLEYVAADGSRKQPVMIHSAKFGSIERFLGVLTEHYAGAFPVWLAPVQVTCIPVADEFNDYLAEVADQLRAAGVRVEIDDSDDRFPKKIRNASKSKVPFTLIAGGEDRDAGAVSFRFRSGEQENGVPVAEAVRRILDTIETKAQV